MYLSDKKNPINRTFTYLIFSAMLWIFSNFMTDISNNVLIIGVWSKITMIGPLFFGYFFFRLSLIFPGNRNNFFSKTYRYILHTTTIILLMLVPTSINVESVYINENSLPSIIPGPLYILASIYFSYLIVLGMRNIYINYRNCSLLEKLQSQYVTFGLCVSVFFGIITNVILPLFNESRFVNYGPYFLLFFIFFTTFAIVKLNMFNIKVVATELLTFILWIFILIRTLISDNLQDQIINGGLLVLTVIFGILLIRSVIKEVRQRERIQLLATDLEKANVRLTELDRQKSEFVSFATHQLRAPLTAMKGYASLVLEGDMGDISNEVKGAVSRIFDSTNTLATIVDDYLNITRIELGSMKYAFETIYLKTLVEDVIEELRPTIEKSKATFSFKVEDNISNYRITADRDKLKQVITNLIDNSLKYTPSGSIAVTLDLDRPKHKFVLKIKDTGIGISPETMPHLFKKFSRASSANKTNIKGTGLGLYVAKEIATAHHAEIHAESQGEGKGSCFIVEFEPFAKA